MKLLKDKTIYTGSSKIECGYLRYDTRIVEVGEMRTFLPREDDEEVSFGGSLVVPGFIDVHSHGGYGYDAMDASPRKSTRWFSKWLPMRNHLLFLHHYDAVL